MRVPPVGWDHLSASEGTTPGCVSLNRPLAWDAGARDELVECFRHDVLAILREASPESIGVVEIERLTAKSGECRGTNEELGLGRGRTGGAQLAEEASVLEGCFVEKFWLIGNFRGGGALIWCCRATSGGHHDTPWTTHSRDHLER
jgi:hypothetical protein